MILSALAFGNQPNWNDVPVVGIDRILLTEDVTDASKGNLRYRHVADISIDENGDCGVVSARYLLVLIIRYTVSMV